MKAVQIKKQRHIVGKFRREGVRVAAAMYVLFGAVDVFYQPRLAPLWIFLRFVFAASMFLTLLALKREKIRRYFSEVLVVFNQVLACTFLNIMIAQSGGYSSLYIIGLILTSVIAANIFRISTPWITLSLMLSYGPTIAIIGKTAGPNHPTTILVYSVYFFSFFLLHFLFAQDDGRIQGKINTKEAQFKEEIVRFQRTEILKRQFPEGLRKFVEHGDIDIPAKKFIPDAVVGFADITNSTSLANQISLQQDWELKESFIEHATRLATQHGFVVLTQLGDGFLFLANYEQNNNWHISLFSFFEALFAEFESIKTRVIPNFNTTEIGLKCSASKGACLVGFLGKEQTYFTAIGPDVNLAARLCAKAQLNELIITSHIWYVVRHVLGDAEVQKEFYSDLKGFDKNVASIRIKLGLNKSKLLCPACRSPMHIIRTADGLYDAVCTSNHDSFLDIKKRTA